MVAIVNEMIQSTYIQILCGIAAFTFIFILLWYVRMQRAANSLKRKIVELEDDQWSVHEKFKCVSDWIQESKNLPADLQAAWDGFAYEYRKTGEIPDVFEYFTEDLLVSKYGNRKVVESIPAIFLSLGILGTFYGITTGVESIDQNAPTQALQSGIESLMSGMQIAFYSSIAGIVLSLLFQILDRTILFKLLLHQVQQLKHQLDRVFPLKKESHLLQQIVDLQATQARELKETLEVGFTKMTDSFERIVKSDLLPSFKENQLTLQRQVEQMQGLHHMFDVELVPKIANELTEVYDQNVLPMLKEANSLHHQNAVTIEQLRTYLTRSFLPDYLKGLKGVIHEEVTPYLHENNHFLQHELEVRVENVVSKPIMSTLQEHHDKTVQMLDEGLAAKLTNLFTTPVTAQMEINQQSLDQHYQNMLASVEEKLALPLKEQSGLLHILNQEFSTTLNEKVIPEMKINNEKITQMTNTLAHPLEEQRETLNKTQELLSKELRVSNEKLSFISSKLMFELEKKLQTMVDYFVKNIYEKSENHINHVGHVVNDMIHWQEKVYGELDTLVHSLDYSAERQMDMSNKTHVLTDSLVGYSDKLKSFSDHIHDFTDTILLKQERLSSSADKLLDVSEKNEEVSKEIGVLIESVTKERAFFHEEVNEKMKSFLNVLTAMESQASMLTMIQSEISDFVETFTIATSNINELTAGNKELAVTLQDETARSRTMITNLNTLMDNIFTNNEALQTMQQKGFEYLEDMVKERQKIDQLKEDEYEMIKEQLHQYDERMNQLIAFWRKNADQLKRTQHQFTNISLHLDQSIDDMTKKLENGLTRSFDKFGKQLSSFNKQNSKKNTLRF